ncbi:oligophrenin-1-like [Sphaerodactylus townsendi]|uniref:oligophrenin-1-like n=1 Tax=Sphaerodactylus townsendi TaxID=933632 RepID=UPI002026E56D|nr:oligophrenin-1-like [Sphaerodactylus townsendi]
MPSYTEAPRPLQRSRLPSQRPVEQDPGKLSSESKAEPCAEVDVGRLVSRLQDKGTKFASKAANGLAPGTASLKGSSGHMKRPAPRPGVCGKEALGDSDGFARVRSPGEKPTITRPPVRPPDPPCKAPVTQKLETKPELLTSGPGEALPSV